MNLFRLDHKVAAITGGGSGIGRSIATMLAAQGAQVFILDFNVDAANTVANDVIKSGGKAKALACNVAVTESVAETFSNIFAEVEAINILVNCAGISHIGNLEHTTEEDFKSIFDVNVKGIYNCMKAVIANMKVKGGVILNMASIASSVGIQDRFAYSMSKGAVLSMTQSVARDYVQNNIRCNCISPARVHTSFVDNFLKKNYPGKEEEMFNKLSASQPVGRMGKPDEIGALAVYLCSDEASFVTGSDYLIDGGFTGLR